MAVLTSAPAPNDKALDDTAPVQNVIRNASRVTGAPFAYMVSTAARESSFNPNARVKSSSATGLYQFIDSTWLATLKEFGPAYGYERQAAAIEKTARGYQVADPAMRRSILNLRYDAVANATMAGMFTQKNSAFLEGELGRGPSAGELYIAHFLGPQGAAKFIQQAARAPNATAAALFPDAARANPTLFYHKGGQPRSLENVYAQLVSKHESSALTAQQSASTHTPEEQGRGWTGAHAAPGALFRNLFTPDRKGAVSPVLAALWTQRNERAQQHAAPIAVVASRAAYFPMTSAKDLAPQESSAMSELPQAAALPPAGPLPIDLLTFHNIKRR